MQRSQTERRKTKLKRQVRLAGREIRRLMRDRQQISYFLALVLAQKGGEVTISAGTQTQVRGSLNRLQYQAQTTESGEIVIRLQATPAPTVEEPVALFPDGPNSVPAAPPANNLQGIDVMALPNISVAHIASEIPPPPIAEAKLTVADRDRPDSEEVSRASEAV